MRLARGLLVGLLLVGQALLLLRSLSLETANYDETEYIYAGTRIWRERDLSINPHPPLVKYLAGLGVLTRGAALFADPDPGKVRTAWPQSKRFLNEQNRADYQNIVIAARVPMLLLWVLLGLVVYLWASELYGPAAGLVSLGLFVLCPNTAAQGRLVSTDMGLVVFGVLTFYLTYRAQKEPAAWRFVLAGLALGAALGSRFQGLVVLALVPALSGLVVRWSLEPGALRRAAKCGALQLGVAALVLLALYQVVKIHYYPGGFKFIYDTLTTDLKQAYILSGEISHSGWWHYFPMLMFYKVPPLHLLTLLVALGSCLVARPRREEWFLLLPVLVMFSLAIVSRVNYGVRHILVETTLCWILAGRLVLLAGSRRPAWAALALVLVGGVVENARIHPHYLAYISPLAGGPRRGYRLLADSNLDAGQDLANLARELKRKRYGDVYLSYFGTADPRNFDIPFRYLPGYFDRHLRQHETARDRFPRYIAISASYLQLYEPGAYHWLLRTEPVDQVGYSIQIYDRQGHPEWLAYLAGVFAEAGDIDRAIQHLRMLLRTAPEAIAVAWPWQLERLKGRPRQAVDYSVALHHAGFDPQARQLLERLVDSPDQMGQVARNNLAVLLGRQADRLRDTDLEAAATRYQRAFRLTGKDGYRDARFHALARAGKMETFHEAFTGDPELVRRHGTPARYLKFLGLPRKD